MSVFYPKIGEFWSVSPHKSWSWLSGNLNHTVSQFWQNFVRQIFNPVTKVIVRKKIMNLILFPILFQNVLILIIVLFKSLGSVGFLFYYFILFIF